MQVAGSLLLLCFAMGNSSYFSMIYAVLAAIGLFTAFGTFRLKKWARYSTLALSTLLVLLPFGIILDFVQHLDHIASNSGSPADADAMQYIVSFEIGLLLIKVLIALPTAVLGGFWLYYFNRLSVKQLFANLGGESN